MTFWLELAPPLLAALLIAACGFLWKLTKTMSRIDSFIEATEFYKQEIKDKLDHQDRRIDVHDVLWSTNYRRSVNSSMIAKGDMDMPYPKDKR